MSRVDFASAPATPPFSNPSVRRRRAPTLRQLAERDIRQRLQALLNNEKGTKGGEDIESLHDMRVASRRLREALRIYAGLFPPKKLRQALRDVRRITRALGLVREVDVNIQQLHTFHSQADAKLQLSVEFALAVEYMRQRQCRAQMIKKLDNIPARELQEDIAKLLKHARGPDRIGAGKPEPSRLPYHSFARRHLGEGLQTIRVCLDRLALHPTLHLHHRLRVSVKKFRYAVELLSRAWEWHRAQRILKELKRLQDELGGLHDQSVLHATLHELRAQLRKDQLPLIEAQMLRLMRALAARQSALKHQIEWHLQQLGRRRFFEKTLETMRVESPMEGS